MFRNFIMLWCVTRPRYLARGLFSKKSKERFQSCALNNTLETYPLVVSYIRDLDGIFSHGGIARILKHDMGTRVFTSQISAILKKHDTPDDISGLAEALSETIKSVQDLQKKVESLDEKQALLSQETSFSFDNPDTDLSSDMEEWDDSEGFDETETVPYTRYHGQGKVIGLSFVSGIFLTILVKSVLKRR